ncbi:MAG TPA: AraC family transcriptional regulator [Rhodothermales bacterium]|nr:AraC family transcriptional regulator [Rhodothermales bacterium]
MGLQRGGIGSFFHWEGGCLFIGSHAGFVPLHAHYAIQIVFGSDDCIQLRSSTNEPWTNYVGGAVPSRQRHELEASRVRFWAIVFIEPETREGRALTERYLQNGIAALPEDVIVERGGALFQVWQERRGSVAVAGAAQDLVRALIGGVAPAVVADPRILQAVAYINEHLDTPLSLETVAAEVYLSPSRFRHLFVEQTGVGFRPYVLWRRFLRAWDLTMAGASLSEAAHGAGFADAAHLTRTSRSMFGFPPSVMPLVEAPWLAEGRS